MKAWSDEWRCARLRLQLRDEELFQGETVSVEVCASASRGSAARNSKNQGEINVERLLQRWREHCEAAQVQIQIVEAPGTDGGSNPSPATLFRQETQFCQVSVAHTEDGADPVVVLKAQFDLRVRHEFWDREVVLIVHVTPRNSVVAGAEGLSSDGGLRSGLMALPGASLLRDEWATSQLLALTREEAQPPPVMTRRVERRVVVTRPLQLEVETRELAGQRVGILARASNAHSTLALAVRDLHLHLDQSLRTQKALGSGEANNRFRVVSADKVPFPVVLLPQERYNFLFVLEPVELMAADESPRGPEAGEEVKRAPPTKPKTQKKGKPAAAPAAQHTLLTLSWQAVAVTMDAVTENRTIAWSPKASLLPLPRDDKAHQTDLQRFVSSVLEGQWQGGAGPGADFRCVRLLPDSALQVSVAPLSSAISVGSAVTVCVTVANRSARSEFDVTLILPSRTESAVDASATGEDPPSFVGFEASHRLGLIRPGSSVRRSLHVAFLRLGRCALGPLVLVDDLTRTCFMSGAWEVFIKN
ncbi:anoctamin-like protein [Phytophthora cinnamomi]|uniref:anoctamin-like protein n=1 Tax=Phytophthora cinnamomi TaxID=4785 RepID=UPI00355A97E0|nr:anoctamin-like protein [Phytophthora cinnamomi]